MISLKVKFWGGNAFIKACRDSNRREYGCISKRIRISSEFSKRENVERIFFRLHVPCNACWTIHSIKQNISIYLNTFTKIKKSTGFYPFIMICNSNPFSKDIRRKCWSLQGNLWWRIELLWIVSSESSQLTYGMSDNELRFPTLDLWVSELERWSAVANQCACRCRIVQTCSKSDQMAHVSRRKKQSRRLSMLNRNNGFRDLFCLVT